MIRGIILHAYPARKLPSDRRAIGQARTRLSRDSFCQYFLQHQGRM